MVDEWWVGTCATDSRRMLDQHSHVRYLQTNLQDMCRCMPAPLVSKLTTFSDLMQDSLWLSSAWCNPSQRNMHERVPGHATSVCSPIRADCEGATKH